MNLQDLKNKEPEDLLKQADQLEIENPSSLRKQDLMFAILKKIATEGETITGLGVIEIMQDGFGFLRSAESNYLPGPDDIYVSPSIAIFFKIANIKSCFLNEDGFSIPRSSACFNKSSGFFIFKSCKFIILLMEIV